MHYITINVSNMLPGNMLHRDGIKKFTVIGIHLFKGVVTINKLKLTSTDIDDLRKGAWLPCKVRKLLYKFSLPVSPYFR